MESILENFKNNTLLNFDNILISTEKAKLDIFFEKIDYDLERSLIFSSTENKIDDTDIKKKKHELIEAMKNESCEVIKSKKIYTRFKG